MAKHGLKLASFVQKMSRLGRISAPGQNPPKLGRTLAPARTFVQLRIPQSWSRATSKKRRGATDRQLAFRITFGYVWGANSIGGRVEGLGTPYLPRLCRAPPCRAGLISKLQARRTSKRGGHPQMRRRCRRPHTARRLKRRPESMVGAMAQQRSMHHCAKSRREDCQPRRHWA